MATRAYKLTRLILLLLLFQRHTLVRKLLLLCSPPQLRVWSEHEDSGTDVVDGPDVNPDGALESYSAGVCLCVCVCVCVCVC